MEEFNQKIDFIVQSLDRLLDKINQVDQKLDDVDAGTLSQRLEELAQSTSGLQTTLSTLAGFVDSVEKLHSIGGQEGLSKLVKDLEELSRSIESSGSLNNLQSLTAIINAQSQAITAIKTTQNSVIQSMKKSTDLFERNMKSIKGSLESFNQLGQVFMDFNAKINSITSSVTNLNTSLDVFTSKDLLNSRMLQSMDSISDRLERVNRNLNTLNTFSADVTSLQSFKDEIKQINAELRLIEQNSQRLSNNTIKVPDLQVERVGVTPQSEPQKTKSAPRVAPTPVATVKEETRPDPGTEQVKQKSVTTVTSETTVQKPKESKKTTPSSTESNTPTEFVEVPTASTPDSLTSASSPSKKTSSSQDWRSNYQEESSLIDLVDNLVQQNIMTKNTFGVSKKGLSPRTLEASRSQYSRLSQENIFNTELTNETQFKEKIEESFNTWAREEVNNVMRAREFFIKELSDFMAKGASRLGLNKSDVRSAVKGVSTESLEAPDFSETIRAVEQSIDDVLKDVDSGVREQLKQGVRSFAENTGKVKYTTQRAGKIVGDEADPKLNLDELRYLGTPRDRRPVEHKHSGARIIEDSPQISRNTEGSGGSVQAQERSFPSVDESFAQISGYLLGGTEERGHYHSAPPFYGNDIIKTVQSVLSDIDPVYKEENRHQFKKEQAPLLMERLLSASTEVKPLNVGSVQAQENNIPSSSESENVGPVTGFFQKLFSNSLFKPFENIANNFKESIDNLEKSLREFNTHIDKAGKSFGERDFSQFTANLVDAFKLDPELFNNKFKEVLINVSIKIGEILESELLKIVSVFSSVEDVLRKISNRLGSIGFDKISSSLDGFIEDIHNVSNVLKEFDEVNKNIRAVEREWLAGTLQMLSNAVVLSDIQDRIDPKTEVVNEDSKPDESRITVNERTSRITADLEGLDQQTAGTTGITALEQAMTGSRHGVVIAREAGKDKHGVGHAAIYIDRGDGYYIKREQIGEGKISESVHDATSLHKAYQHKSNVSFVPLNVSDEEKDAFLQSLETVDNDPESQKYSFLSEGGTTCSSFVTKVGNLSGVIPESELNNTSGLFNNPTPEMAIRAYENANVRADEQRERERIAEEERIEKERIESEKRREEALRKENESLSRGSSIVSELEGRYATRSQETGEHNSLAFVLKEVDDLGEHLSLLVRNVDGSIRRIYERDGNLVSEDYSNDMMEQYQLKSVVGRSENLTYEEVDTDGLSGYDIMSVARAEGISSISGFFEDKKPDGSVQSQELSSNLRDKSERSLYQLQEVSEDTEKETLQSRGAFSGFIEKIGSNLFKGAFDPLKSYFDRLVTALNSLENTFSKVPTNLSSGAKAIKEREWADLTASMVDLFNIDQEKFVNSVSDTVRNIAVRLGDIFEKDFHKATEFFAKIGAVVERIAAEISELGFVQMSESIENTVKKIESFAKSLQEFDEQNKKIREVEKEWLSGTAMIVATDILLGTLKKRMTVDEEAVDFQPEESRITQKEDTRRIDADLSGLDQQKAGATGLAALERASKESSTGVVVAREAGKGPHNVGHAAVYIANEDGSYTKVEQVGEEEITRKTVSREEAHSYFQHKDNVSFVPMNVPEGEVNNFLASLGRLANQEGVADYHFLTGKGTTCASYIQRAANESNFIPESEQAHSSGAFNSITPEMMLRSFEQKNLQHSSSLGSVQAQEREKPKTFVGSVKSFIRSTTDNITTIFTSQENLLGKATSGLTNSVRSLADFVKGLSEATSQLKALITGFGKARQEMEKSMPDLMVRLINSIVSQQSSNKIRAKEDARFDVQPGESGSSVIKEDSTGYMKVDARDERLTDAEKGSIFFNAIQQAVDASPNKTVIVKSDESSGRGAGHAGVAFRDENTGELRFREFITESGSLGAASEKMGEEYLSKRFQGNTDIEIVEVRSEKHKVEDFLRNIETVLKEGTPYGIVPGTNTCSSAVTEAGNMCGLIREDILPKAKHGLNTATPRDLIKYFAAVNQIRSEEQRTGVSLSDEDFVSQVKAILSSPVPVRIQSDETRKENIPQEVESDSMLGSVQAQMSNTSSGGDSVFEQARKFASKVGYVFNQSLALANSFKEFQRASEFKGDMKLSEAVTEIPGAVIDMVGAVLKGTRSSQNLLHTFMPDKVKGARNERYMTVFDIIKGVLRYIGFNSNKSGDANPQNVHDSSRPSPDPTISHSSLRNEESRVVADDEYQLLEERIADLSDRGKAAFRAIYDTIEIGIFSKMNLNPAAQSDTNILKRVSKMVEMAEKVADVGLGSISLEEDYYDLWQNKQSNKRFSPESLDNFQKAKDEISKRYQDNLQDTSTPISIRKSPYRYDDPGGGRSNINLNARDAVQLVLSSSNLINRSEESIDFFDRSNKSLSPRNLQSSQVVTDIAKKYLSSSNLSSEVSTSGGIHMLSEKDSFSFVSSMMPHLDEALRRALASGQGYSLNSATGSASSLVVNEASSENKAITIVHELVHSLTNRLESLGHSIFDTVTTSQGESFNIKDLISKSLSDYNSRVSDSNKYSDSKKSYLFRPDEVYAHVAQSLVDPTGKQETHFREQYGDELFDSVRKVLEDLDPGLFKEDNLEKFRKSIDSFNRELDKASSSVGSVQPQASVVMSDEDSTYRNSQFSDTIGILFDAVRDRVMTESRKIGVDSPLPKSYSNTQSFVEGTLGYAGQLSQSGLGVLSDNLDELIKKLGIKVGGVGPFAFLQSFAGDASTIFRDDDKRRDFEEFMVDMVAGQDESLRTVVYRNIVKVADQNRDLLYEAVDLLRNPDTRREGIKKVIEFKSIVEKQAWSESTPEYKDMYVQNYGLPKGLKALAYEKFMSRKDFSQIIDVPTVGEAVPGLGMPLPKKFDAPDSYYRMLGRHLAPNQVDEREIFRASKNYYVGQTGDVLKGDDDFKVSHYYDLAEGITKVEIAAKNTSGELVNLSGKIDEFGDFEIDKPEKQTFMGRIGRRIAHEIPQEMVEETIEELIFAFMNLIRTIVSIQSELSEVDTILGGTDSEGKRTRTQFLYRSIESANMTAQPFEEAIQTNIQNLKLTAGIDDVTQRTELASRLSEVQLGAQTAFGIDLDTSMEAIPAMFMSIQDEMLKKTEDRAKATEMAIEELSSVMSKFIVVQRESGVAGEDLIQVYASLATTAKEVGMSQEELMAFTSSVAVKLNKAPTETAESIRLTQEYTYGEGQKKLANLGIATKQFNEDTQSVELIPFIDILRQAREKIDESPNLSKQVTNALGGRSHGTSAAKMLDSLDSYDRNLAALSPESEGGSLTGNEFEQRLEKGVDNLEGALNTVESSLGQFMAMMFIETGVSDMFVDSLQNISEVLNKVSKAVADSPDLADAIFGGINFAIQVFVMGLSKGVNTLRGFARMVNTVDKSLKGWTKEYLHVGDSTALSMTPAQKAMAVLNKLIKEGGTNLEEMEKKARDAAAAVSQVGSSDAHVDTTSVKDSDGQRSLPDTTEKRTTTVQSQESTGPKDKVQNLNSGKVSIDLESGNLVISDEPLPQEVEVPGSSDAGKEREVLGKEGRAYFDPTSGSLVYRNRFDYEDPSSSVTGGRISLSDESETERGVKRYSLTQDAVVSTGRISLMPDWDTEEGVPSVYHALEETFDEVVEDLDKAKESSKKETKKVSESAGDLAKSSREGLDKARRKMLAFSEGFLERTTTGVSGMWKRKPGKTIKSVGSSTGEVLAPVGFDLMTGGFSGENITQVGTGIAAAVAGGFAFGPYGAMAGYAIGKGFSEWIDIYGIAFGASSKEKDSFAKALAGENAEKEKYAGMSEDEISKEKSLLAQKREEERLENQKIFEERFNVSAVRQKAVEAQNKIDIWDVYNVRNMRPAVYNDALRYQQTGKGGPIDKMIAEGEQFRIMQEGFLQAPELERLFITSGASHLPEFLEMLNSATDEHSEMGKKVAELTENYKKVNEEQKKITDEAGNVIPILETTEQRAERIKKIAEDIASIKAAQYDIPLGLSEFGHFGTVNQERGLDFDSKLSQITSGNFEDIGGVEGAQKILSDYSEDVEINSNIPQLLSQSVPLFDELGQKVGDLPAKFQAMGTEGQNQFSAMIAPLVEYDKLLAEREGLEEQIAELKKSPEYLDESNSEAYDAAQAEVAALEQQRDLYGTKIDLIKEYMDQIKQIPGFMDQEIERLVQIENARKKIAYQQAMEQYEKDMESYNEQMENRQPQFSAPSLVDVEGHTSQDIQTAIQMALQKQEKLSAMFPEWEDEFKESQFMLEAGGQFKGVSGVDQGFFNDFLEQIQEKREKEKEFEKPDLVDLSKYEDNEYQNIMSRAWQLQDQAVGLVPELGEEYEDNKLMIMRKNNDLMLELGLSQEYLRMAMDENTKATEDTLRGHYNLPSSYRTPTVWDYYNEGGRETGEVNFPGGPGQEGMVPLEYAQKLAEKMVESQNMGGGSEDDDIIPDLTTLFSTYFGDGQFGYTTPDEDEPLPEKPEKPKPEDFGLGPDGEPLPTVPEIPEDSKIPATEDDVTAPYSKFKGDLKKIFPETNEGPEIPKIPETVEDPLSFPDYAGFEDLLNPVFKKPSSKEPGADLGLVLGAAAGAGSYEEPEEKPNIPTKPSGFFQNIGAVFTNPPPKKALTVKGREIPNPIDAIKTMGHNISYLFRDDRTPEEKLKDRPEGDALTVSEVGIPQEKEGGGGFWSGLGKLLLGEPSVAHASGGEGLTSGMNSMKGTYGAMGAVSNIEIPEADKASGSLENLDNASSSSRDSINELSSSSLDAKPKITELGVESILSGNSVSKLGTDSMSTGDSLQGLSSDSLVAKSSVSSLALSSDSTSSSLDNFSAALAQTSSKVSAFDSSVSSANDALSGFNNSISSAKTLAESFANVNKQLAQFDLSTPFKNVTTVNIKADKVIIEGGSDTSPKQPSAPTTPAKPASGRTTDGSRRTTLTAGPGNSKGGKGGGLKRV